MAVFYTEGETKIRPGVYQRYTNIGFDPLAGARDGYCAIPIQANWGPLNTVVRNTSSVDLVETYGDGEYASGYTVPAAKAMFDGGAAIVYTYRMGTGGTAASKSIGEDLTVTAKYPGTASVAVAVQQKLGVTNVKTFMVYFNKALVEKFDFAADSTKEGDNLIAAAADSEYVTVSTASTAPATVAVLAVASGGLTGGANPTVNNGEYSKAFSALEPYYYNTIALDVDDDTDLTLSLLLQSYLDNAYTMGKQAIAVVGEKTTVDFEDRCEHATAFNDATIVYLGGGYLQGSVSKDGVLAICYTAGLISSTPSNQGITRTVINGATALCESLTYSQYEDAILAGMLLLSMSPDGSIWYDSGVNTLVTPEPGIEDNGWKKIRRVKVRFEMFDRIDRTLNPKVGKVSADSDGVADVVQAGQRILDAMVSEGKVFGGATFAEDPNRPYEGDSAWFIIQADDIDSLEKIYLHYQFRYSQNS